MLGFAAGFMLATTVVAALAGALSQLDGGADLSSWAPGELLLGTAIAVPGYLAIAAVLRLLCRFLVVRTSERGPDDCAWCGYTRGSAAITRCPECGREASSNRYGAHAFVLSTAWLARRGGFAAAAVLLTLSALAVKPVWTGTIPSWEFYRRFAGWERVTNQTWTVPGSALGGMGAYGRPCVWMAEKPGSDRGVYVMFSSATAREPVGINVGLAGKPADGLPMGFMRITADLDPGQTRRVLSHGVPDGLVRALYAKADEVSWGPNVPPKGEARVDPAPYFRD